MSIRISSGSQNAITQSNVETIPPAENAIVEKMPAKEDIIEKSNAQSASTTSSRLAEFSLEAQAREYELASKLSSVPVGPLKEPQQTDENLLYLGSQGPEVFEMQQKLNEWRIRNGKEPITENGNFGKETEDAVHEFQQATGLKNDGIVGGNTNDRMALENDKNFLGIPADTQNRVRDLMNSYQKNPTARENLKALSTDENFAKASKEAQDHLLNQLSKSPANVAHTHSLKDQALKHAQMEGDANFQKLHPDTQKQFRAKMNDFSGEPDKQSALLNLAKDRDLPNIPQQHQQHVLKAFAKNPNDTNANNLTRIISSDGFRTLDEPTKTRVLNMFESHAGDIGYTTDLATTVASTKFAALPPAERQKVLNVFENTNAAGRSSLFDLLNKTVDGKPALLNKDTSGTTLLDNLDRLATKPLDQKIKDANGAPQDKAEVLAGLLQEVSDPSKHIDQGNRGTCAVATPSRSVAEKNPAEYARLVADLATTGKTKLANGEEIGPPSDGFKADGSGRSVGERLLQSSLMTYARPDGNYRNNSKSGIPDGTVPGGLRHDGYSSGEDGLSTANQKKVLDGLFNKKFEYELRDRSKDGTTEFNKIQDVVKKGKPAYVGVAWLPGPPEAGHAVEITKIEGGKVYFRNPWGSGVGPNGPAKVPGPLRNVEDSERGIESMTVDEFKKILRDHSVEK